MSEEKRIITFKDNSYEVLKKLGEGFAGEVFEVLDRKRNKIMALKLLKGEAFAEGQLNAFKREFGILTGFHHPHLCTVYDFGFSENESRYFFTIELVKGENLYAYTEKLPIEKIEEIFVEITDALGFIHAQGLIHFDLKGSNILVTKAGEKPIAKIIDFGLAVPPVDAPDEIVGTVRYMSPEMISKNQTIDYRADLYSLGMVLYRMLAGRYPPQGTTMEEVLSWHVKHTEIVRTPLEERGIPKYLTDVVEKLLNPIPTERFSSAPVMIKYIELHSGRNYKQTQRELLTTLTTEGPLVGRTDTMYEIRSMLHKISKDEKLPDGASHVIVLTGPAGIGKSRLIKEARYIAQLAGINTILVKADEEGVDLQSFAKALGFQVAAATEDRGKISREIAEFILAREKLCLMVDNLDECGDAVREVIAGVAGSLYSSKFTGRAHPIYVVATLTTEIGSELPSKIALAGSKIVGLTPFTREDLVAYQQSFLGETTPPPQQTDDILKFSGGIPELVRIAIASLESPTGKFSHDATGFFRANIEKLGAQAKTALCCIAIAEKPISHENLEFGMGTNADAAVSELIKHGLIVRLRSPEGYELAASAIMPAAKGALPEKDIKAIAKRLLEVTLKEKRPDVDAAVRLANIGASREEMLNILFSAAEEKEKEQNLLQACRYNENAVSILGDGDPKSPPIHRKIARYLILAHEYEDAIKHLDAASKNSQKTVEDITAFSWIERLEHKPGEALKHVQDALDICKAAPSDPECLRLTNEMALCHLQTGDTKKAIEIFTSTLKKANSLPEEKQLLVMNNNLGMALSMEKRFDEAISFYKEKRRRFEKDKRLSSSILTQLAYVYEKAGRFDEALESYKQSWETASAIGDIHSGATILGNLINICINKALFSDALRYAEESLGIASRAASEKDLAANLLTIGNLYINMGLEDIAIKYLNESEEIFKKLSDAKMGAWVLLAKAYLDKNTSKTAIAIAKFTEVAKRAESVPDPDLRLWSHHGLAEILLDSGKISEAGTHISGMELPWPGKETAREKEIKVELLRQRFALLKERTPPAETSGMLADLAALSTKLGFRELAGEAYFLLSSYYQKIGDEKTSAKELAKAKEIIDDIARTLAEEYRDSFLKQKFRKEVSEESIRIERSFIKKLGLDKDAPEKGETQITDETKELPTDQTKDLGRKKK